MLPDELETVRAERNEILEILASLLVTNKKGTEVAVVRKAFSAAVDILERYTVRLELENQIRSADAQANYDEALLKICKAAYEAYGRFTGNKNFQGNPMPTWDELPEKIQHAWHAATFEVYTLCLGVKTETQGV